MRAIESTNRKLELQASIWRKEVLKTRGFEEKKLSLSEAPSSEVVHQKLTSSEVLKIIRSWRSSKAERLEILEFVKSCYSHAYVRRRNGSLEQWLFQRNLKALDAYPLKSAEKGQYYNCTTATPLTMSAIVQGYSCTYIVLPYTWNEFEIVPLYNNNQIKQHIIDDLIKLQQRLFWCAGNQQRLFHTSI